MNKFGEIIAHIEEELAELIKINNQLKDENELLRNRLSMPTQKNNAELSLEEAFSHFEVEADSGSTKKIRAYNALVRSSYREKRIIEFEGISAYELLAIRNMGFNSLAIIIIMMEHFGVSIEIPDIDCAIDMPYYRTLHFSSKHTKATMIKLKKAIKENRARIIFKD